MIAFRLAGFLHAGDISGFALRLGLVLATVGLVTRLLARLIKQRALAIPSVGRRLGVLLVIATVVPVEMLRRQSGESCEALARRIVDAVHGFEGDQGPSDDITLLMARRATQERTQEST